MAAQIIPRLIRHRDAPAYLAMDRNRFDAEVRPHLVEVPIGIRGVGFDRLELDAWADAYIASRGRPGRNWKGNTQCEPERKESASKVSSGSLTSSTEGREFSSGLAPSHKTTLRHGSGSARQNLTPAGSSNFEQALNACGQLARQST